MYIFLDVDGVLNTKKDWERKIYSLNQKCVDEFCNMLDKIDDPKIVLSSTWRNGIARDGSTAVHIDKLQEALSKAGILSMDKTATAPDGSRSREIDYYLRTHNTDSYIILDDDIAIFELREKTPNLFRIDPSTGLTKKDVKNIERNKNEKEIKMINIYSGVIYTIPIPKGDVNEILKKIVKIVSEELGIGVHASLENSTYWATELGIPIGDYFFEISTNDFKEEWEEDKLKEVGLKIKEVTGTKVGMNVQRPWSISINGEELKEPKKERPLSQEVINRLLTGLPLEEEE